MSQKITIERTTDKGYETKEFTLSEALEVLNLELENKRTIFIDGRPFFGDIIQEDDIKVCKKEISVTNRLVGG